jgi:hypothetical protein
MDSTMVNGEQVDQQTLCDNHNCYAGDVITIGKRFDMDTFSRTAPMKYSFTQTAASARKTATAVFIVEDAANFGSRDTIRFTVNRLTTGIADREKAVQFALYPNPARTVVGLQSKETLKGYSIHDVSGRLVQSGSFFGFQKEIPVTQLAPGLYTLRLVNSRCEAGSRLFVKE